MFKRIITLLIGYLSLYLVAVDIPTASYDQFMEWVSGLILNPSHFIMTAFMILIGIISYGNMVKTVITDFQDENTITGVITSVFILISAILLFRLNGLLILIFLPCSVIYGIISLSQRKVIERSQEGAE